jgi:hypothetical protein
MSNRVKAPFYCFHEDDMAKGRVKGNRKTKKPKARRVAHKDSPVTGGPASSRLTSSLFS